MKFGAALSYLGLAINILVGLIYTPWMINSIGREDYGLYTLALSVISLFVFDFGIGQAVTRFIAKYLAEGNLQKANNCLGLVYKLYFYIDIFLFIILVSFYFFIPQIYQELTPEEIEKFKIIYIAVSFFSVISFPFIPVNGVLTANEKFIQLKLCDLANKLFMVVAMSVCLFLGYGLYALVLVHVFSGLATIVLKLLFIKRDTNTKVNFGYYNGTEFKEILGFSGWVTVKSFSERMIFTLSPTVLGMVSGSVEIALFGIASTIEGYVYSFAGALNGLFLPRVSKIAAKNNEDVLTLMIKVGRLLFFIVGLVIVGFVSIGREFIEVWLGDGYTPVYIASVLIILPSMIYVPQEIGCSYIAVQNKIKHQALVYLFMGVCNIVLGYFFAEKWGCLGLCCSIFIAYNIRNIGLDWIFKHKLRLNTRLFFQNVFIKMGVPFIISFALCYSCHYIPLDGWVGFVTKGCLVTVIYFTIMWKIALDSYERNLIIEPVNKIIGFCKITKPHHR
ncbi:MAG: oligosaccharide flippase family protein [Prevotella sp.]|nr:oligosaccharide flippase family protein [Candidatus Equicola faecalis]